MATPWETLLTRAASGSTPLSDSDHQVFSTHPSVTVRLSWATRDDIPSAMSVRRALAEHDPTVLRSLISNPAVAPETLAVIAQHHPDRRAALQAALHGSCPDDTAADVLQRRVRVRLKRDLRIDDIGDLQRRPRTAAVLASVVPAQHLAHIAQLVAGDDDVMTVVAAVLQRRARGGDESFREMAVGALMVLDAVPERRTRSVVASVAGSRGDHLARWVSLHDGCEPDLMTWSGLSDIAPHAGPRTAALLLTRAAYDAAVPVLTAAASNPSLDNTFVARHLVGHPAAVDVVRHRQARWSPEFVEILGDAVVDALDRDTGLVVSHVGDIETLELIAARCVRPRVLRAVAAHPECTTGLAFRLPAAAALEAFHDPVALHRLIRDAVGAAADAAATLSMDFSGTLQELLDVARGLIGD